jgi:hypothetical protein
MVAAGLLNCAKQGLGCYAGKLKDLTMEVYSELADSSNE